MPSRGLGPLTKSQHKQIAPQLSGDSLPDQAGLTTAVAEHMCNLAGKHVLLASTDASTSPRSAHH